MIFLNRPDRTKQTYRAFTLIELLIVIAIILILIAIALPNFLEAQIRAKVTKSQAELRTLLIAYETYFIDFKLYPNRTEQDYANQPFIDRGMLRLTSPIPYIQAIPRDPFAPANLAADTVQTYEAGGTQTQFFSFGATLNHVVWGRGPSGQTEQPWRNEHPHYGLLGGRASSYASTNGTRSAGSIFICMGDGRWFGVRTDNADAAALKNPALREPYLIDDQDYNGRLPPHSWN
jgi:prepilin-type N-terminal cleavage/methylation domain-containing protein